MIYPHFRVDSYRLRDLHPPIVAGSSNHPSRSGSGSEIYERLGGPGNDVSQSDDSDYNRGAGGDDSMDRRRGSGQNGGGGGGIRPSQIRNKKRQQGKEETLLHTLSVGVLGDLLGKHTLKGASWGFLASSFLAQLLC